MKASHLQTSFVFSLLFLIISSISAQQFLDEMELSDISETPEISTHVLRDQNQALLIVKSQITGLRFLSNNFIHQLEEKEPGTWFIYLSPGTHRFSFQAAGFLSAQHRFFFKPKEVKGLRIDIIPMTRTEERNKAIVVIDSDPGDAEVYIDNELYGTTPYTGKLIPGSYKFELRKRNYKSYEKTLVLIKGRTHPINLKLEPKMGAIKVTTKTPNAKILIDSLDVGLTPYLGEFIIGKHFLEIRKEHFLSYKDTILIAEGQTFPLNISLQPDPVYLKFVEDSLAAIKKRVQLREKKKGKSKTWLFIGGGAVVIAGGAAILIMSSGGTRETTETSKPLNEPPPFP
jgi:hypothetical protein